MPPDDPRVPFVPTIRLEPVRIAPSGFDAANTSGLDAPALASLNVALRRLMAHGLSEREAKIALHRAVADWLAPADAADTDLERLLSWR